ncbi:MAG: hypothetical protein K8F32_02465 [Rhodocyclaceae bacterium]|nr:hypothetical protein [Rhodocyclaceae bacterium]
MSPTPFQHYSKEGISTSHTISEEISDQHREVPVFHRYCSAFFPALCLAFLIMLPEHADAADVVLECNVMSCNPSGATCPQVISFAFNPSDRRTKDSYGDEYLASDKMIVTMSIPADGVSNQAVKSTLDRYAGTLTQEVAHLPQDVVVSLKNRPAYSFNDFQNLFNRASKVYAQFSCKKALQKF